MKKFKFKPIKHIIKEGSIFHVTYWNSDGPHCSEPDCEMNIKKKKALKRASKYIRRKECYKEL